MPSWGSDEGCSHFKTRQKREGIQTVQVTNMVTYRVRDYKQPTLQFLIINQFHLTVKLTRTNRNLGDGFSQSFWILFGDYQRDVQNLAAAECSENINCIFFHVRKKELVQAQHPKYLAVAKRLAFSMTESKCRMTGRNLSWMSHMKNIQCCFFRSPFTGVSVRSCQKKSITSLLPPYVHEFI